MRRYSAVAMPVLWYFLQNNQQCAIAVSVSSVSCAFVICSWVDFLCLWCHHWPDCSTNYFFLTCWCQKWQFVMFCNILFMSSWLWVMLLCYSLLFVNVVNSLHRLSCHSLKYGTVQRGVVVWRRYVVAYVIVLRMRRTVTSSL